MSFTSLIARSAAQTGTIGGGLGTAAAARSAVQTGTIGGGSGAAAVASLPNSNILDAINSVREYKAPPAPCGAGKSLDIVVRALGLHRYAHVHIVFLAVQAQLQLHKQNISGITDYVMDLKRLSLKQGQPLYIFIAVPIVLLQVLLLHSSLYSIPLYLQSV